MKTATLRQRRNMVRNGRWAANHQASIHYAEIRPIPEHITSKHLPYTTDCSGFVTLLAKWAGLPDPNGLNYNGQGFTGTLLTHLPHISQGKARFGDLVVFGGGNGEHVVMLMQSAWRHHNPLIVSHGQEDEPRIMPLLIQATYFTGQPTTFLRSSR